jgi:hypothetical protein
MDRRGFLGAILAAGVAPAVVKAASLMPLWVRSESGLIVRSGNGLLTIEIITAEALKILNENFLFVSQTRALTAMNKAFDRLTIHIPSAYERR